MSSARIARLGRLAAAAALAVCGGLALSTEHASAAACSGSTGVTVVVDYGSSISVRCAPGDPSSGFAALSGAGFSVTRVQQFPSAVCRINGFPASDPCVRMPPSSAYWSYWHAARGGSWSYASTGPADYNPAPGSVEGWSFGAGSAPGTAPPAKTSTPAPTTPKSTPKPSQTTPNASTSTPRSTSAGTAPYAPVPPDAKGPVMTPGSHAATTAAGSASATTTTGASGATSPPASADDATSSGPIAANQTSATSGGSSSSLFIGLGLVAALAAGGGFAVWRRRQT